jgi:hypothetical protein
VSWVSCFVSKTKVFDSGISEVSPTIYRDVIMILILLETYIVRHLHLAFTVTDQKQSTTLE